MVEPSSDLHQLSHVFQYIEYVEYFFFALYSISVPVYMIIFYILVRYRYEFYDTFFSLCRSICLADICLLICSQIAWKIPLMGWFTELYRAGGRPLCTVLFTVNQLFSKTSDYCMIDLVLNRLTAIVFRNKYSKLWRRSRVHWAIGGQWLLALLVALPTILFGFTWIELDIGKANPSLFPGISVITFYEKYWWGNVVINCGRVIVYIISSVLILIKAWRFKKTITPLQENSFEHAQYRADLRLSYAILAMCLVDMVKMGWYVFLLSLKIDNLRVLARLALVYESTLGEINAWSKPYFFMAGCPRLRAHFFAMFHRHSDSTASVSETTLKAEGDVDESPPLDQTALSLQIPSSSHGNRPPQPSLEAVMRY
uniref:G-protein coupled receptors family 1 profile domain-containing protein n=1 Tax=Plectus sambesii TaxID=2011161 RepID=A0A914XRG6_9BILA